MIRWLRDFAAGWRRMRRFAAGEESHCPMCGCCPDVAHADRATVIELEGILEADPPNLHSALLELLRQRKLLWTATSEEIVQHVVRRW